MSLYMVKRAFIDVIKLSIFRWKISLVYLDGSNIIMCPYEREARMSGAKMRLTMQEVVVVCFEWRRDYGDAAFRNWNAQGGSFSPETSRSYIALETTCL